MAAGVRPSLLAERGRGGRAKLQDQPGDLAAGAAVGDRVTMLCALYAWYSAAGGREIPCSARRPDVFHNTSVP